MELCINNINFKTKKQLKEHVQKIRDINKNQCVINNDDFNFLMEFTSMHPEFEEKYFGRKILGFKVQQNPEFKHYVIYAQLDNGKIEDIAMNNIIRGRCANKKEERDSAYRSAVFEQIREFKATALLVCVQCNHADLDQRNMHVDHFIKFKDIVKEFESMNGVSEDTEQYTKSRQWFFKDLIFRKKFEDFHKQKAILRILCAKCNLTLK